MMLMRSLIATLAVCWCVSALAAEDEGPRVNTSDIARGELTRPDEEVGLKPDPQTPLGPASAGQDAVGLKPDPQTPVGPASAGQDAVGPKPDLQTPVGPASAGQSGVGLKPDPQAAGIVQTSSDRLELDTTIVTGNRELPKVLYIVPWKKADLGELPAQPFNTLLDEVLSPVDRDVFRREVTYYGAVTSSADATQSTSTEQR